MTFELVGTVDDFPVGTMKKVKLESIKEGVLISSTLKGLFCTGNKCTHSGAPLHSVGVLSEDRIICGWHGACFNVCTGDIEDFPALKRLPKYPLEVRGDQVYVEGIALGREIDISSKDGSESPTIAIIGGGPAALGAIETLVSMNFPGKVYLFCKENYLPYDRTKLSKGPVVPANIELRPRSFYEQLNIDIHLNCEVTSFDAQSLSLTTCTGEEVFFDKAILCTGATPFNIPVHGHQAENVFTLRTIEDAAAILKLVENGAKNVVFVGTGFIGLEIASMLKKNFDTLNIKCIGIEDYPLSRVFGETVGRGVHKMYSEHIQLHMGVHLSKYVLDGNLVTSVQVEEGESYDADMVIVGAGVRLNTGFVKNVNMDPRDKSVLVDAYMHSVNGVYAAGDIAKFPYQGSDDNMVRVEHFSVAESQGKVAALNILGNKVAFHDVQTPYFWTALFNGNFRYTGHASSSEHVFVQGNASEAGKFCAFYHENDSITAVATFGHDTVAATCSELLRKGKMPTLQQVKDGISDWKALLIDQ